MNGAGISREEPLICTPFPNGYTLFYHRFHNGKITENIMVKWRVETVEIAGQIAASSRNELGATLGC